MVGIVIGAVGTIFIATPLLATLMEREPEYARRKKAAAESDAEALRESEAGIAAEPAPTTAHDVIEGTAEEPLVPVGAESEINGEGDGNGDEGQESQDAKRERRRQRRKTRPHGRAR
jgi:hypothetical protein